MNKTDFARFMSHVNKTENCWLWTSGKNYNGYGLFRLNDKKKKAHRVSFEHHFKKLIDDKIIIKQTCFVRTCVNPEHLLQITVSKEIRYVKIRSNEPKPCKRCKNLLFHYLYPTDDSDSVKANTIVCKACGKRAPKGMLPEQIRYL
jgi:hypothetical protein